MTGKTQRENAIENSPLLRPPKVSQFRLNLNFIVRYERLPTYIHAYLPTYMPTYLHTCLPTYLPNDLGKAGSWNHQNLMTSILAPLYSVDESLDNIVLL